MFLRWGVSISMSGLALARNMGMGRRMTRLRGGCSDWIGLDCENEIDETGIGFRVADVAGCLFV